MKKILLGVLILPTLVIAGVTREGDNKINTWAKKTYVVEDHGSSALELMYGGKREPFELENVDTKGSEALKGTSPLKYSYFALELMYNKVS